MITNQEKLEKIFNILVKKYNLTLKKSLVACYNDFDILIVMNNKLYFVIPYIEYNDGKPHISLKGAYYIYLENELVPFYKKCKKEIEEIIYRYKSLFLKLKELEIKHRIINMGKDFE